MNESSLISLRDKYTLSGIEKLPKKEEENLSLQNNSEDFGSVEPLKHVVKSELTSLERETVNLEENLISLPEIEIYDDDEREESNVSINLTQTTGPITSIREEIIEKETKCKRDNIILDRKNWFLPKFLQSKKQLQEETEM